MTASEATAEAERRDKGLGKLRLVSLWLLGAAFVVVGIVWGRPHPVGWAVGLIVSGLGIAMRSWAAGYLIKSKALITGGPYAYVRNPLYLGRVLIGTGMCIAARLPDIAGVPPYPWPNLIVVAGFYAFFFGWYMPRKERVETARLSGYH